MSSLEIKFSVSGCKRFKLVSAIGSTFVYFQSSTRVLGKPILIKVGFHEKTGKIISAQAVGSNAAQRINTFACAILDETNVEDFRKMETAYAPSIAPTLDALTLVCDVASLKLAKKRR